MTARQSGQLQVQQHALFTSCCDPWCCAGGVPDGRVCARGHGERASTRAHTPPRGQPGGQAPAAARTAAGACRSHLFSFTLFSYCIFLFMFFLRVRSWQARVCVVPVLLPPAFVLFLGGIEPATLNIVLAPARALCTSACPAAAVGSLQGSAACLSQHEPDAIVGTKYLRERWPVPNLLRQACIDVCVSLRSLCRIAVFLFVGGGGRRGA